MHVLVEGWRKQWNQGTFPFYWVQLAPYYYAEDMAAALPRVTWSQTLACDLPNSGMVVINDAGDRKDIHPADKVTVAHRLVQLALKKHYQKDVPVWSGPVCTAATLIGDKVILNFDHCGTGLRSRDGNPLTHFELADATGTFVTADAAIVGPSTLMVSAQGMTTPCAVRFAWDQAAEPNLVNSHGWPAGLFIYGNIPQPEEVKERLPYSPLEIMTGK